MSTAGSETTELTEEGEYSSDFTEDEDESDSDDGYVDKEQPGIVWTGYLKKVPILLFRSDTVKTKRPELKAIGEKYHLAYKMVRTECRLVRNLLGAHGFHEAHPNSSDFNLVWTGSHLKPYTLQSMQEFQKINHFPRSYELTRKDRLFKNVQRMQHMKGIKHFDFIPQSFIIPSEYQDFCTSYLKDKGPYIVKPIASSRGRGIFLINHPEQVPLDEQVIVGRYINNPLLIDGFKFDIRLYIAVTSYDPLVIYMYEEGLARFATVRYEKTTKSIRNQCMHLTNYSVNKKSGDFVQNDDPDVEDYGNKWSLGALLRYLRSEGYDTTALMMRIEDVVVKTILAAELPIATACKMFMPFKGNCFELYGFDILVDTNLRPWILEVNLSPSLACDAPLDLKIKSNMVSDLFSLTGFVCHDPMVRKMQQSKRNQDINSRVPSRTQSRNSATRKNETDRDSQHAGSAGILRSRSQMSKQRPSSASSYRGEAQTKKFAGLTGEEIKIVRRVKEEYQRRGGFVRIYPTADSWDLYNNFLQFTTTHNLTLHQRLYPDRHKNMSSRTTPAGYCTSIAKLKSVHLHSAPSATITMSLEGEELLTNAMRRSLCYERRLRAKASKIRKKKTTAEKASKTNNIKSLKFGSDNGEEEDEDERQMYSTSMFSTSKPPIPHGTAVTLHSTDPHTRANENQRPSMLVQQPQQKPPVPTSTTLSTQTTPVVNQRPPSAGKRPPSAGQRPQADVKVLTGTDSMVTTAISRSRGVVMQGVVEPPKYDIRPPDPPPPARPPSPPIPQYNVIEVLEKGGQLSKVQARSAFAMYLSRVQSRLTTETNVADVEDLETSNEQMDLVLRFLRRAAVNLQQSFKVIVPSRKLPINDRRRILAKQLGDFVHIYNKETEQLKMKSKQEPKKQLKRDTINTSAVNETRFEQYVNTASESDLEDLLTIYTKINKSASIFLGGNNTKSIYDSRSQQDTVILKRRESQENLSLTNDGKLSRGLDQLDSTAKSSLYGAVSIYSTKLTPSTRQRPASASTTRSATRGNTNRPMSASSSRPSSGHPTSLYRESPDGHPGPKTFEEYNEDAINDALQRLAVKQQARTYSSTSASANILNTAPEQQMQQSKITNSVNSATMSYQNTRKDTTSITRTSGRENENRENSASVSRTRTQSLDRPITMHSERYSNPRRVPSTGSASSTMTSASSYSSGSKNVAHLTDGIILKNSMINGVNTDNTEHSNRIKSAPKMNSDDINKYNKYPQGGSHEYVAYNGNMDATQHSKTAMGNYGDRETEPLTKHHSHSKSAHSRMQTQTTSENKDPGKERLATHSRNNRVSSGILQSRTANETFNSFIDDIDSHNAWQNDLSIAYNQVTGISPQSNYAASQPSFQVSAQQQMLKQQKMMKASKQLLESSKAKHQAMIAHAHAVRKSNEAATRVAQASKSGMTTVDVLNKDRSDANNPVLYAPKPPSQPPSGKKPISSHRLASVSQPQGQSNEKHLSAIQRTALTEEGVYGNQFYSSLKYDSISGLTKSTYNPVTSNFK